MIFGKFLGGGICNVCRGHTLLKYQDSTTALRVGNCCVQELRRAHEVLSHIPGLTHPSPPIPPTPKPGDTFPL